MNTIRFSAFLLFLSLTNILSSQETIDGIWSGEIKSGSISLDVDIEIKPDLETALLSIPMQKLNDVEATRMSVKGDSIEIIFDQFRARYEGTYNQTTNEIVGQWNQGRPVDLNFKKTGKKTEFKRPQTPKEPFPYIVQDVSIRNETADITLDGTLTMPEGDGPFPLAILISGSGRQNRDSDILGHKPFHVIADHLAKNGVAVIRYDDRGVSKSTGTFSKATTEDLAQDAEAVFSYAETLDKIDKSKVGIIGHSEGGMIAPWIASRNSKVDFIISLAGPGVPISDLMTYQNVSILTQSGMSEEGLQTTKESLPKIYALVNQDKEPSEIFDTLISEVHTYYDALPEKDQKLLAPNKASYYMQLSQSFFSPWFRYFLAYDPTSTWEKVTCPVLAINGSEDIQVSPNENIEAIKRHLAKAGNKNVNTKIFDGLNHLMQPCVACDLREYATIETTFDQSVLEEIVLFLKGL